MLPRKRRWAVRLSLELLAVAALCSALVGGVNGWYYLLRRPGPLAEARAVVMPHGGTARLAEVLTAERVVSNTFVFRAAALLTWNDGTLRAAEFDFPAGASVQQVLAIRRTARPVLHRLTIPEGLTVPQIALILGHADVLAGDVGALEEGLILPQTYDYERGTTRSMFIARARAAMDKELSAAWADREPGLPLASEREALILASIVERETAKPEERPHVAAVYLNRLRSGMKLQADPTVVYLASGRSGVLDHPLTRAELGRDDPFNTYRSVGLPPAPICSPGLKAIQAVLHPSASEDLFFVADGSGGHVFSRSYEAHDAAVSRWRALVPPTSHGHVD